MCLLPRRPPGTVRPALAFGGRGGCGGSGPLLPVPRHGIVTPHLALAVLGATAVAATLVGHGPQLVSGTGYALPRAAYSVCDSALIGVLRALAVPVHGRQGLTRGRAVALERSRFVVLALARVMHTRASILAPRSRAVVASHSGAFVLVRGSALVADTGLFRRATFPIKMWAMIIEPITAPIPANAVAAAARRQDFGHSSTPEAVAAPTPGAFARC